MNFKTTAFLLLLAALIGAFLVFINKNAGDDLGRTGNADTEEGTILFPSDQLSVQAVDRLTLDAHGSHAELVKTGNDWKQVQPIQFTLEAFSVQPLLDAAGHLRYTRKFTPGQGGTPTLAAAGLDPADATLTLHVGGAKPRTITIKVGKSATGGRNYAMIDDKPEVLVVSDALRKLVVDQKPEEWRRRYFAMPRELRTTRIAFAQANRSVAGETLTGDPVAESFEMVRNGSDWALGGQGVGRVDPDKVRTFLNSLTDVHIDRFVADAPSDLSQYGLDKPSVTLTLQSNPAPESEADDAAAKPATQPTTAPATQPVKPLVQVFRIGSPTDMAGTTYFATYSEGNEPANVVFTINKADRQKLDHTVKDFRDARITTAPVGGVRALSIERDGKTVTLERSEKGLWAFRAEPPAAAPAFTPDNDAVSELIEALVLARADGFVPNAKPATAPLVTVRLTVAGRPEPEVLRIYSAVGSVKGAAAAGAEDKRLVMRNNEPIGLLVPEMPKLHKVLASVETLRDRQVIDVKPAEIKSIKITRTGLPAISAGVLLTHTLPAASASATQPEPGKPLTPEAAGTWALADGAKIDTGSVDALLASIAPLHAELWTTEDRPNARDLRATIDLEVTTVAGKTLSARIYPDTQLGAIPGHDAEGACFRVSKSVTDALLAEFRDRSVVAIDLDDIQQVRVADHQAGSTDKPSATVITRDDMGQFHSETLKDLSQANAGALFDSLANLKAQRFASPPTLGANPGGRTIEVNAKSGKKASLELYDSPGQERLASSAGADGTVRWFTLPEDLVKKLRASLTAPKSAEQLQ